MPRGVDIDGDGVPAEDDCDESRPDVHVGATEFCSFIDEDCDGTNDEGSPTDLCVGDTSGDTCMLNICCPANEFNFDGDPTNRCECVGTPAVGLGATCADAIDVGEVSDLGAGATVTVSDNALPTGRDVWYRFRAVDTPDTSCDNFHVRVRFLDREGIPETRYVFHAFRGGCAESNAECALAPDYREFSWRTDFRAEAGRLGECLCGPNNANANSCQDNGTDFMIRVRRVAGVEETCEPFTLEITNGAVNPD